MSDVRWMMRDVVNGSICNLRDSKNDFAKCNTKKNEDILLNYCIFLEKKFC